MELLNSVLIFFAGLWAGTINSVVGSGTLVTFPVLIALGYAPVTASISNAMGLVAGNSVFNAKDPHAAIAELSAV